MSEVKVGDYVKAKLYSLGHGIGYRDVGVVRHERETRVTVKWENGSITNTWKGSVQVVQPEDLI